jgi:hypothetical protein
MTAPVEHLDDKAQLLRVSWSKMHNYAASFATTWFELKKDFDAGQYPGWTFAMWVGQKAGFPEEGVNKILLALHRGIAAEYRAEAEQAERKRRAALEVERQRKREEASAKRQAAAQEREHRRQEAARSKAVAASKREAIAAVKAAIVERVPAAVAAKHPGAVKRPSGRQGDPNRHVYMRERRARLRREFESSPPANATLAQLLAECSAIDENHGVALGQRYAAMRDICQRGEAGKDEDSHVWTWGKWSQIYIKRPRADILRCITDYQELLTRNESIGGVNDRSAPRSKYVHEGGRG